MLGTEYVMQKPFFRTALKKLIDLGKTRDHYETLESQHRDWKMLVQKAKENANKRRVEGSGKKQDPVAMDTSFVGQGSDCNCDGIDLNAMGEAREKANGP